jgi:PAS domain S-box-containing protein
MKKSEKTIDDILEMISRLEQGDFSQTLENSLDPNLTKISEKLNQTAKKLASVFADANPMEKFFKQSIDLMCIANTDGKFKKVNPAFIKELGYSEEELLSCPFLDFIHPEDVPATLKEIEKLAAGITTINFENRYRTKAGNYLILDWSATPDPVTGFLYCIARDVTEKNETQENLVQTFKALDNVSIVAFTDTNGKITKVNDRFCEISGYSREELIGQNHRILNSGAHPKEFFTDMWQTISSGKIWQSTIQNHNKNGENYFVESVISPIFDSAGHITRYMAIRFDVTNLKNGEIENIKLSKQIEEAEIIAKIGFWELNLETFQGKWSKGHLLIFGLSLTSEAPTFEKFMGFVHPEDRLMVQTKFNQILSEKNAEFDIQFRIEIGENKSIRWIKERGVLELNKEGKPIRMSGSIQDITQEKEAEIELKSTLASYATTSLLLERVGDMAKIGGWELDLSTGKVLLSLETQRLHEIDQDYVPLKYATGAEWYPPEAWPIIQSAVKKAIEEGISYDLESPFITAKGKNIWVRIQGFPVIKGNKVIGLQGTFQDITERKQLELENKFIGESMGFGVWKFYPKTGTLEWDQQMYALYGFASNQFSGAYEAWESALTPAAKERAVEELGQALSGEKDFNTEFEIKLRNGESRYIAGRGFVIRNENQEPIKMIGLNWDVSKRVHAEEELKIINQQLARSAKLASLGEMSAGIAHEINNPLTIISGTVGLLSKFKNDPEKMAAKIETIQKSCNRIARIVGGLKKFSRTGDKNIFKFHDISNILNEVLILTASKAKSFNTVVTIESSVQLKIECDEVEIEQVFVNLINNAIDAIKDLSEKWVKISIFEEVSSVVIRLMDSGPGIPENVRNKLFDPFFTTKKVGEGTGLGLSITKGILDEHQASIAVLKDSPNTCFEIKFPKKMEIKNAA